MPTITIDPTRCKKDGICARVCPATVIVQRERLAVPELDGEERCISCGQCVAVCPQGALAHAAFPPGSIHPIELEKVPGADQVLELLRSRRSIRAFREKPVERAVIEEVIEARAARPAGTTPKAQSSWWFRIEPCCARSPS